jgi:transposase InsO family protein
MVVAIPTTVHVSAPTLAKLFVQHVASKFGLPSTVVSDRDSKFTSHFWQCVCARWGTTRKMSSAYHPQTDGQTERMNRLLEETLRHYTNDHQSNWVELLPMAEFAINNAWNSSIQSTPFYLNFGQHPRMPAAIDTPDPVPAASTFVSRMHEAVASAKRAMEEAHERMRAKFGKAVPKYEPGQQVLLSSKNLASKPHMSRKLLPKWVGPFTISDCIVKQGQVVAVTLALPADWRIFNTFSTTLVKPFLAPPGVTVAAPPNTWCTGLGEPVVEKLLARRLLRGARAQVLVQWSGNRATWVEHRDVARAHPALLATFLGSAPCVAAPGSQPERGGV